jgi:hypothetical protein
MELDCSTSFCESNELDWSVSNNGIKDEINIRATRAKGNFRVYIVRPLQTGGIVKGHISFAYKTL